MCNVFNEVMLIEIHTAQPLTSGPSCLEVDFTTAKLKKCKSSGSDQIQEALFQAGVKTLLLDTHKFINSVWNKEEFRDQGKGSIFVLLYKKRDTVDCNNYCDTTAINSILHLVNYLSLKVRSLYS
jgi:hypothetical protein